MALSEVALVVISLFKLRGLAAVDDLSQPSTSVPSLSLSSSIRLSGALGVQCVSRPDLGLAVVDLGTSSWPQSPSRFLGGLAARLDDLSALRAWQDLRSSRVLSASLRLAPRLEELVLSERRAGVGGKAVTKATIAVLRTTAASIL